MDQTKRYSGEKNLLCELDKKDESKRQRGEKLKYFSQSVLPSLLWQAALRPRFLSSTFKALKLCAKFDNGDEEMQ